MDDDRQVFEMRNRLAAAGFEVLPDEIVAAESRLIARGIVAPTFREYLDEILGKGWFDTWCRRGDNGDGTLKEAVMAKTIKIALEYDFFALSAPGEDDEKFNLLHTAGFEGAILVAAKWYGTRNVVCEVEDDGQEVLKMFDGRPGPGGKAIEYLGPYTIVQEGRIAVVRRLMVDGTIGPDSRRRLTLVVQGSPVMDIPFAEILGKQVYVNGILVPGGRSLHIDIR